MIVPTQETDGIEIKWLYLQWIFAFICKQKLFLDPRQVASITTGIEKEAKSDFKSDFLEQVCVNN